MTERGLARFVGSGAGTHVDGDSGVAAPCTEPEFPPQLARFLQSRPPAAGETCELCGELVPIDDHRHVVDLERRGLLCSCRGCALLFIDAAAGGGRYRTVPERYLQIVPFALPANAWTALQIPVGMAFIVHNTQQQRTVAFYPSPGGATESELDLRAWSAVVAANPALEQVEPDVEAALLRTEDTTAQCFVVPVDSCYELVGTLRLHWRGFDGGQQVREHLERFFADVAAYSTRRGGSVPGRAPAHPPGSPAAPRRASDGGRG